MADDLNAIFAPVIAPKSTAAPTPKAPLREIFSDTLKEPASLGGLLGREEGVDYSQGAGVGTRYNLARTSNQAEQVKYLTNKYGEGNFRKDPGGNWLVRDKSGQWQTVAPTGLRGGLEGLGVQTAVATPPLAGTLGGAAIGEAIGGPPGAVAGAAFGAGGMSAIDEFVKYLQGFSSKSPLEFGTHVGKEAAIGGVFQGAGPLARSALPPLYRGTSSVIGSLAGVTPESRAVTQSLERLGTRAPIASVAPGLKAFEYDRQLRNRIATDPMVASRIAAMDTRMAEVLQGFGYQGADLAQAMAQIQSKTEALSAREAGAGVVSKLQARETALLTEEDTQRRIAETALRSSYNQLFNLSQQPTGRLGATVAGEFEAARAEFTEAMNTAYRTADTMTGSRPIVDMTAVSREANNLIKGMDPQAVPPIIARLVKGEGALMTFEEAHNVRTTLREMAKVKDLSPIGQRRGNVRFMASLVDNAISDTQDHVGQQAAQLLKQADRTWSQGIVRFTNQSVNELVQDVRSGRMPDASVVANTILDANSKEATQQIWGMLTPETQRLVRVADLKNMIDGASVLGKDGRRTLNPDALLTSLEERQGINSVLYPKVLTDNLRELAVDFKALDGSLDVTNLPPNQIRQALERAVGARRALDEQAKANPRLAVLSGNPDLVERGARFFMQPGNEAITVAGARLIGVGSPEWREVQRYAAKEMFKSAIVPKGLGRTVVGGKIEDYLSGLTSQQQALLFPGGTLADIKLISQQARALFPELEEANFGASLAAAAELGHLPQLRAIRAYTWSRIAGRLADSATLQKIVAGQLRQNPDKGRAMLSYMLQGGAERITENPPQLLTPRSEFGGLFGTREREPLPPEFSMPSEPRERHYGGPNE